MKSVIFSKNPLLKIFLIQYGQILSFEVGLIICYMYTDINFYVFQFALVPIFIILIFSKYNKSITTIDIDYNNKLFTLKKNYFLVYTKTYKIPFEKIFIQLRWKWLLNFYSQVIEISENGKLIAVIPIKSSIWNKKELEFLIHSVKDLEMEGEIKANFGNFKKL